MTARRPSWADLNAATAATAAVMADPAASPLDRMKAAEAEEKVFLAARAAGSDIPDLRPVPAGPRLCVTEISVPRFGDDGVQRLHARMKQPEPEAEQEAGI